MSEGGLCPSSQEEGLPTGRSAQCTWPRIAGTHTICGGCYDFISSALHGIQLNNTSHSPCRSVTGSDSPWTHFGSLLGVTRRNIKLFAIDKPIEIKCLFPPGKLPRGPGCHSASGEAPGAMLRSTPAAASPPRPTPAPGASLMRRSGRSGGSPRLPAPSLPFILLQTSNSHVWVHKDFSKMPLPVT